MTIQGLRTTADFNSYRERPENWRMGILWLEPNGDAPLYALSSLMTSEKTDDPVFHWFDEEVAHYRVALDANISTTGQTAITVASGALHFKPGDVIYVEESAEHLMVTTDPTSDTALTVSRGFAGTTAATVTYASAGVNPNLLLMGSAYEEGSDAPEGRSVDATERDNYCQIFRNTFEITNTARATTYRTGDAAKNDRKRCLHRHSVNIEMAFLLSEKSSALFNGKPRRTTDGIVTQIPADNVFTPASGNLKMSVWEGYLMEIFRYGSNEKFVLAGNQAVLGLQQMARLNAAYQLEQGQSEYGMKILNFTSPFG
ncbi:hypothetical protein LCGC14_2978830, partial [marine sediment metagenome]